jgi:hypothetical protein
VLALKSNFSSSIIKKENKRRKNRPKLQYNGRGVGNQIKKDFFALSSVSDYTPIQIV